MQALSHGSGQQDRRDGATGFTLVELLVVLAILGLLAAIATPQVLGYLKHAKEQTAHIEMKNIAAALDVFQIDNGRYPTQQEGLDALINQPAGLPSWQGPYLKKTKGLVDPWNHSYQYKTPGEHGDYDLFSLGSNASEANGNTAGHIDNW